MPFTFELLGETEEKPIVVVVTPLIAIMVTYLIYTNVIHILPVCKSPLCDARPFPRVAVR